MNRWRLLGVGGVTAVLAAVAGIVALRPDDGTTIRVDSTSFDVRGAGVADAIVPAPPAPYRAGEAVVAALEAYATPSPVPGTAPALVATNPTHEGFPLVVSVIAESDDGDWLQVRLPQRPNGTTGWVRATDLRLWDLQHRVEVSIAARSLRVVDGGTGAVLFESLVSVGSDATPTPIGEFFIDIVNPLGAHPTYGWGQLSVSGFSEVLETFAGGIGQIAIHGWNDPSAMGRNISNGCVRMNNDEIARVAELAPLGTPVVVTA